MKKNKNKKTTNFKIRIDKIQSKYYNSYCRKTKPVQDIQYEYLANADVAELAEIVRALLVTMSVCVANKV